MAKKRTTKKTTKKAGKKVLNEQIVLDPVEKKALRLVDRSDKLRGELEQSVILAASKAVRKVMKDHKITLTPPQASVITSILFEE